MKICVIGQGYIGLPTAALFAKNNCNVVGVDINEEMINNLNNGIVHIEELGIKEIIVESCKKGLYRASLEPEKADAFIITVPTPYVIENYSCDLNYVITACKNILPYIEKVRKAEENLYDAMYNKNGENTVEAAKAEQEIEIAIQTANIERAQAKYDEYSEMAEEDWDAGQSDPK